MSANPLFITLLCEHIRSNRKFPDNVFDVYNTYIAARMDRDEARLANRYGMVTSQLVEFAETLAFVMSWDDELGLQPSRRLIKSALHTAQLNEPYNVDEYLDALIYLRLAREEMDQGSQDRDFTFAHRRFQEYFSTRFLLKHPDRVPAVTLLTDARWREATVVLLQTQPLEACKPILDDAEQILLKIEDILIENVSPTLVKSDFSLPPKIAHILGILQDGLTSHMQDIPINLRNTASRLVKTATECGLLTDQQRVLNVAGIVPYSDLLSLVRDAYKSDSIWLRDTAYQQVVRLDEIPLDIEKAINQSIFEIYSRGQLRKNKVTTKTHLDRLGANSLPLKSFKLLLAVQPLQTLISISTFLIILFAYFFDDQSISTWDFSIALLYATIMPLSFYVSKGFTKDMIFGNGLYHLLIGTALATYISANILNVIHSDTLLIGETIILFNFICWSIGAVWWARRGAFTDPIYWLFLPTLILFTPLIHRNVENTSKFSVKDLLIFLSAILVACLIIIGALLLVFEWLPQWVSALLDISEKMVRTFLNILLYGYILYMLIRGGYIFLRVKLSSRRNLKIFKDKTETQISFVQFIRYFGALPDLATVIEFVRHIRQNNLLIADKSTIFVLKRVLYFCTHESDEFTLGNTQDDESINQLAELVEWFVSVHKRKNLLKADGFVDEIAKLIVQAETKVS